MCVEIPGLNTMFANQREDVSFISGTWASLHQAETKASECFKPICLSWSEAVNGNSYNETFHVKKVCVLSGITHLNACFCISDHCAFAFHLACLQEAVLTMIEGFQLEAWWLWLRGTESYLTSPSLGFLTVDSGGQEGGTYCFVFFFYSSYSLMWCFYLITILLHKGNVSSMTVATVST